MAGGTELQQRAEQVAAQIHSRLGENLYSCVLYGSAVRGDASPQTSDINLLIILTIATPDAHAALADVLKKFPRVDPFILGFEGLSRSQQAFALKFRSIQRNHLVLRGVDPFADFSPDPSLVRFLCEQSLRNLRLRLVHAFVTMGQRDAKSYSRYVFESLSGIFTALSEALRCEGIELPRSRRERVPILQEKLDADASILIELADLKKTAGVLSEAQIEDCHARLYRLLTEAVRWMETRWPTMLPTSPG